MPLPSFNSAAILTKARRSAWDAIDNWVPLQDWEGNTGIVISRNRMEDDLSTILEDDSSYFELPSITVRPGTVAEAYETNVMAKFDDQLVIDVKTAYLDQAEELAEMVWQAIWQSAPLDNPTMSYVRTATGRLPKALSLTRNVGQVGKDGPNSKAQKIWVFTLTIQLWESQDVLSDILQARTVS